MTQADPIIVTQTGSLAVVSSQDDGALTTPETTRMVVEHLAQEMSGLHRISGRWIRINARVGEDLVITADLQRIRFGDDDCAVRMILSPTTPVPIPATELPV